MRSIEYFVLGIPLEVIATFSRMKQMTADLALIVAVAKRFSCPILKYILFFRAYVVVMT
jgi:hypothetical protein